MTITNVHVTSGSVVGKSSVGGLVGWFQRGANVENCSNAAKVSGGKYGGGIYLTDANTKLEMTSYNCNI